MKYFCNYIFLFSLLLLSIRSLAQDTLQVKSQDSLRSKNPAPFIESLSDLPIEKPEFPSPVSVPTHTNIPTIPQANVPTLKFKDSLPSLPFDTKKTNIKNKLKTNTLQKKARSILAQNSSHGSISICDDYGVVPFISSVTGPVNYFHTEGNATLKVFTFPFNASFYYSDKQSLTGLNNYFRFTFDPKQYQQDLKDKLLNKQQEAKDQLSSSYSQKQQLEQKLIKLKSLDLSHIKKLKLDKLDKPINIEVPNINKNLHIKDKFPGLPNELLRPDIQLDSLNILDNKNISDSLNKTSYSLEQVDSISNEIKKHEAEIKEYETKIKDQTKTLQELQSPEGALKKGKSLTESKFKNKLTNYMQGVKKMEIGMCYPDYSTFLVNGTALKGINVEYEKNDFYLAFTYGKTVSNLLMTNNAIQNQLINKQNLFNYFDFNSVNDTRKITAVKFGYGKKDSTHVYFGFLFGSGLPSYFTNPSTSSTGNKRGVVPDKNFVMEIDRKYIINKRSSVDLIYGRSSLQTTSQYLVKENNNNSIFQDNNSNALMVKYSLKLIKTKTNVSATARYIEPFFKSFGLGFMRSDNLRGEIKVEQSLGKKVNLKVFYRRDEDNLLALYNFKTVLQTAGAKIQVKIKRNLSVQLGYNPVLQKVTTKDNTYNLKSMNSITNMLITYNPTIKGVSTLFNFMYNHYQLTSLEKPVVFENIMITNLTQFKKSFTNNLTVGWLKTNNEDSLSNKTWIFCDELSYKTQKGGQFSIGIKPAYTLHAGWQYGFLAKVGVPLSRLISIELSGEKLVVGDMNTNLILNNDQIKNFPYFCNAKVTINW
jgi:hypothetical protein